MTTQYLLQKTNDKGYRRFVAKLLGDKGGTTSSFRYALLWDRFVDAEVFRTMNGLHQFDIVLSDGTDDQDAEAKAYWMAKNGK